MSERRLQDIWKERCAAGRDALDCLVAIRWIHRSRSRGAGTLGSMSHLLCGFECGCLLLGPAWEVPGLDVLDPSS